MTAATSVVVPESWRPSTGGRRYAAIAIVATNAASTTATPGFPRCAASVPSSAISANVRAPNGMCRFSPENARSRSMPTISPRARDSRNGFAISNIVGAPRAWIMLRSTRYGRRPPLKLVAHASPPVLEAELLDRVAAAKSGDPLAPVLIVVPSRRLADHVTRRLVERFGALLGVSGAAPPRSGGARVWRRPACRAAPILDDDLLDTLFTRVVHRGPAGPLRDFARDHPGAASALREDR